MTSTASEAGGPARRGDHPSRRRTSRPQSASRFAGMHPVFMRSKTLKHRGARPREGHPEGGGKPMRRAITRISRADSRQGRALPGGRGARDAQRRRRHLRARPVTHGSAPPLASAARLPGTGGAYRSGCFQPSRTCGEETLEFTPFRYGHRCRESDVDRSTDGHGVPVRETHVARRRPVSVSQSGIGQ